MIETLPYIISGLAVIVSIGSIIVSSRNLRTSKYIDTITTQRIQWIDSLRMDLSDVISGIYILGSCEKQVKFINDYTENGIFDNLDQEKEAFQLRDQLISIKEKLGADQYLTDLIKKIDVSILRLNNKDDQELIQLLDELKEDIFKGYYEHYSDEDFMKNLRNQITLLLKNEWERVKQESKYGTKKSKKLDKRSRKCGK